MTIKAMGWESFLSDRIHHNLYVNAIVYKETIKAIRRIADPGDLILEVGCGTGRTAILLADMGYRIVALDKSTEMVERLLGAKDFIADLNLVNADARDIPFGRRVFKVAYSCEVLEHFDPPEVVKILCELRKASAYVVVDVPNDRCTKRCFGDERFYSNEEWIYMLNEAGLEVKECLHRGLERGKYVGNCSIFLAGDREDNQCMHQKRDVYDYY